MSEPEPQNDVELVERMARGDRKALAALYEMYGARLLSLAIGILRDRSEAEDLLHDAFLEAWRRAADYSRERGSVWTWLALRTRSRALDRIKSAGRRRVVTQETTPEQIAFAGLLDDHERLRHTLTQMPETQQQVLLLAYFEDLSSSEIAERLGIPAGTVKSRMRAALAALREVFGGANDG